MLTKSNIVSLVILPFVFLATWLLFQWLELPQIVTAKANQADSYAKHVTSIRMTTAGNPKDQLSAPFVVHYPQHDTFDITAPHLTIFSTNGAPWYVYAGKGQVRDQVDVIDLWDRVRIERTKSQVNQAIQLTTSALKVYPAKQYVYTQQPVTIEQSDGMVHAIGMAANLKTNTINLLSQVNGQYGKTTLKSDQLRIYFDQQRHLEKVIALGNAYATQGHDTYSGPQLNYEIKTNTITSPSSPQGRTKIIIQPNQKL